MRNGQRWGCRMEVGDVSRVTAEGGVLNRSLAWQKKVRPMVGSVSLRTVVL